MFKGIQIQVLNVKGSFVSLRFRSSNAKSRMKKVDFMQSVEDGTFNIINPDALPEEMRPKTEESEAEVDAVVEDTGAENTAKEAEEKTPETTDIEVKEDVEDE